MKKLLTLLLLPITSFVYANHIGDIDGLDKPFTRGDLIGYDLHVEFNLLK